ncbi:MAG: GIY-YIG nuclease [Gemmatimonadetes bacterium]|nr:MAG: GIY-YIG nuclease [Gemmatimonadota bacterium]
MRQFYVYILSSHSRTLYVGVTNDLLGRLDQHRNGDCEFTARYRISRLVYFEISQNVRSAIEREKEIKAWRRQKKPALITSLNPGWDDLAATWLPETPESADPSSLRSSG